MDQFLQEAEAAISLGITRELLNAFVKSGVKGQRLTAESRQGKLFFSRNTLEAWDAFLKQPWAAAGAKRSDIPSAIKDYLKAESRGQCARCGNGHRLDYAHIEPWNVSYSHHPHNLIRLCTDCHVKFDGGMISIKEIRGLKEKGINALKAEISATIGLTKGAATSPPKNPHFLGRDKELGKLAKLFRSQNCVVIDGIGGIGKTQLVLQFLSQQELKSDWFNLEQFSSLLDLRMAIANYYAAFSIVELSGVLNKSGTVLILDGFESLFNHDRDEAIAFFSELCQRATNAKIIVTSQIDFADVISGVAFMKINEGLTVEDSRSVVKAYQPDQDLYDTSLTSLIEFSDGHPLTLVILSSLIQFYQSPSKILVALKQAGVEVLENPKHRQKNRMTSLEICLDLSFNLLNFEQQTILKYISLFPAGYKTAYLECLTQGNNPYVKSIIRLQYCLATLDQFNFLQHQVDRLNYERVSMLQPIRSFVLKKGYDLVEEFLELQRFGFEYLMLEAITIYKTYMLSEQVEFGLMRFELDLPNYVYAFKESVQRAFSDPKLLEDNRKIYLNLITGFTAGLYKYLFTRGHFEYGIFFNTQGARAHIALEEYHLAMDDLLQVGTLFHRRYRLKEADQILEQLKELEKRSGVQDPMVRLFEGQLMQPKDPRKAVDVLKEGLSLMDKIIKSRKDDLTLIVNRANILMEIGKCYEMFLHDYRSSLPYYEECYQIERKTKDYGNLYCTSHHLGNAHAGLNEFGKALYYYKESLNGFIQLGQSQYISNSFAEIGRLRIPHPELDYSFIDNNIVSAGLEDIESEIKLSFGYGRPNENHRYGNLPREVVNKLWNIVKVVSLSDSCSQLNQWGSELSQWLEERLAGKAVLPPLPWFYLKIAELAAVVLSDENDEDSLKSLKRCCYLYGSEADNDIINPFGWLALWLRENKIDIHATENNLLAEVEDDFDGQGGVF